jgi:prolipoprotein diacylglyceryl transferase
VPAVDVLLPLLSIPSPDSNVIVELGPLRLRWYGTLLAVAVFLAGWMTQREFRRRGLDPEQVYTIAAWCVPGGIIGARIYHVVTDWDRFSDDLASIPALWEGGLGMFGVIVGGATGAYIAARRTGIPFGTVFDSIAPGLIAAQAIGRFGNWFNQELFGRPTDLPWALEIDPGRRPARFAAEETFHPTFLYESLWNVLVCCVLLVIARRAWRRLRPGVIFACYLVGYSLGRFPIEGLRVDPAHEWLGLRLNQYVFAVVLAAAVAYLAWALRRPPVVEEDPSPRRRGPTARRPGEPAPAVRRRGSGPRRG